MNETKAISGRIFLGILGSLGCLMFSLYFAFMAFANYFGRNPSHGWGSFGVIMCGVSLWGAFKSARSGFKKSETE